MRKEKGDRPKDMLFQTPWIPGLHHPNFSPKRNAYLFGNENLSMFFIKVVQNKECASRNFPKWNPLIETSMDASSD